MLLPGAWSRFLLVEHYLYLYSSRLGGGLPCSTLPAAVVSLEIILASRGGEATERSENIFQREYSNSTRGYNAAEGLDNSRGGYV